MVEMRYLKSHIAILCILLTLVALSIANAEGGRSFCERNPDARVCKSAAEVRQEERLDLKQYCSSYPNTEKCRNKRTTEKVRNERLKYCEENPKACAARPRRW